MAEDNPVVGHKTFSDGKGGFRHEPLREREADELMARVRERDAKRAADMPTERDALNAMFEAYLRLNELGWSDAIYCPKDGSPFNVIEAGSTGVHTAHYDGAWPKGTWWVHSEGDLWPSRPILWKKKDARPHNIDQEKAG